jgi:peptide/nickel transport system permease protein
MSTDISQKKKELAGSNDSTTYRTPAQEVVHQLRHDPLGLIGLLGLIVIVAAALVGPLISPFGPTEPNYNALLQSPSLEHPMGTDQMGRDTMTRLLVGARYSLLIGVGSISVATTVGILGGIVAGYTTREWLDETLMRFMDVLISFPAIVLGLAVMGILGTDPISVGPVEIGALGKIIVVIGLVYTPRFARITRGAVLKERGKDYVRMARIEGASHPTIVFREILLNILSPILVMFSYRIGSAMIVAAGLGFLGIGVQPPTPSWGAMISTGKDHLHSGEWWLTLFPGIALAVTIMCWNLLGDSVRDALDPNVSTVEEA